MPAILEKHLTEHLSTEESLLRTPPAVAGEGKGGIVPEEEGREKVKQETKGPE